ncbi:unnamed protein product [Oncorhynchus mykiss]|uniref:Rad21/Rec8-like protein N-terminal domain-containing protein n=1 Tax=Oncorhynchus mykiss TaxID=8022 RepID=A0A060Y6C7_ONCMY|nr:unnamed protein product [Oncorhynchus mykiss]
MFFSPSVLNRHTGCFSTIWLAATKGIKIPQKDFLKVNVQRTCNDIMDYVLVRIPPPLPGLPRPRFSLYLSSQLQYGVIIVYHRQCGMLLGKREGKGEGEGEYLKISWKISTILYILFWLLKRREQNLTMTSENIS